MALRSAVLDALQRAEPVVQSRLQLLERQRGHPGRGQFHRERDAFEARADTGQRHLVDDEPGARGAGSFEEELRRFRQGRHRPRRLAVDGETLAARRQHREPGTRRQQGGDDVGAGVQHVLAVVEQEQHMPGADPLGQGTGR